MFGFVCASSYWGILVFRVCLCLKLLGGSIAAAAAAAAAAHIS